MKVVITCETPKDVTDAEVLKSEDELIEDTKLELEDYGYINVDVKFVKQ